MGFLNEQRGETGALGHTFACPVSQSLIAGHDPAIHAALSRVAGYLDARVEPGHEGNLVVEPLFPFSNSIQPSRDSAEPEAWLRNSGPPPEK